MKKTVFYSDGVTPVRIGDLVERRIWLRKRRGRVNYVPGLSSPRSDLERDGLTWIEVIFPDFVSADVVDPETGCLVKKFRLVERGEEAEAMPSDLMEEVAKLAAPVTLLKPNPSEENQVSQTETKFGGVPFTPNSEPWICECGTQMEFVCQFWNQEKEDLFVFFYCFVCRPWGSEPSSSKWALLRYAQDEVLESSVAPLLPTGMATLGAVASTRKLLNSYRFGEISGTRNVRC